MERTRRCSECSGLSRKARLIPAGPSISPRKAGRESSALLPRQCPKAVSYGRFVHDNFDASTTWKDIEWIRSVFPGKMILKGILDPEDAKRAVQTNIDGILVSNHGGRQLDSVTVLFFDHQIRQRLAAAGEYEPLIDFSLTNTTLMFHLDFARL
jgi:hypothetical protein